MFKLVCLVALFAVASAQNWWPQPIQPPRPEPIDPPQWQQPQPPQWQQPQPPQWQQPQPPQWQQPEWQPEWQQPPQRPSWPHPEPLPPTWNQPQPIWPEPQPPHWNQPNQPRQGVRDSRCPAQNGRFVTLLPHDRNCSQFFMCNDGMRFTFDCPAGQNFDRVSMACGNVATARC